MNDRRTSWLLGIAASLFYLCFHSYFHNFDGIACAIAVEIGDFKHLVHGNHLAYGIVGWAFFSLWRLFDYQGQALLALQALSGLIDGAAVGVFYSALRRAEIRPRVALGASLGLAVSYAYWLWSLEVQGYQLGVLVMAFMLREALSPRPHATRLGLWQGAAILTHIGHALSAPVAAFALRKRGGSSRFQTLTQWAAAAGALVLGAYAWAGAYCIQPRSLEDVRVWLLGSAALGLRKDFAWHGGYSLHNVREWSMMDARIFSDFLTLSGAAKAASLTLGLCSLAAAATGAWRAWRGARRYEATLCLLWLAFYAALYMSWEPYTFVYRLSDLLPLWLLIALAFEASRASWPLAALVAALAVVNGIFGIAPKTDPASNPDYEEAVKLGTRVPPEAWVIVNGNGQVYIPYFAHRKPLNMRYWDQRLPALAEHLDRLAARGERVYATGRTLGSWRPWFESYGLWPAGNEAAPSLYEVRRTNGKPSGSTTKRLNNAPRLRKGPNGIGSERLTRPRANK